MSSDANAVAPVPVPNTAVPFGITDPVEKARTELKAALAAIEVKANVPRRVSTKVDDNVERLRKMYKSDPIRTTAAVIAGAVAVGAVVWGVIRLYTR